VARHRLAVFCGVFCEVGAFTIRKSATILKAAARPPGRSTPTSSATPAAPGCGAAEGGLRRAPGRHGPRGILALAQAGVVPVLLPDDERLLKPKKAERAP
jgi:hypothetical protein